MNAVEIGIAASNDALQLWKKWLAISHGAQQACVEGRGGRAFGPHGLADAGVVASHAAENQIGKDVNR
jgi:hypothetical protein